MNNEESIEILERKFDEYRVYGDERDLEIFEEDYDLEGPNCSIPIKAPYIYPELKNDKSNQLKLSPKAVEDAIGEFVKYKFRNWTKVELYRRIEDRVTDDFDLSNSCAVPLSTYTELLNARRTDPAKAKEHALKIVRNIQLINDYKYGKISEQRFKQEMGKRREEYAMGKDIPRSMVQLKKDNELILNRIEKYIGKIGKSIHDQKFELAPLSIHIIPKTHNQNYSALVTSGLSFLPMSPPNPMRFFRYSELLIKLPLDWPLPVEELKRDDFLWPIEQLNRLMKYVHTNHQWFSDMHTFGNGDPPLPFANNTGFCGFLFTLPVLSFPPEFCELRIDDTKSVIFLQLIPLYKEEMDYAITEGSDALLKKFEENNIPDYVDINRENLFGLRKPSSRPAETKGYICPFCNTVLRNFKSEGIRCPTCKRVIVKSRDGKLISLDIPEEKPSVPKKNKIKAEKLFFEGLTFFKQLKGEKALSSFNKAIKLNPYDKRVWSLKVQLLNRLGRYKEAKECAEQGMKYILRDDIK